MKLVAPSILSADFANLERDILDLKQAGADWVHVDVMDGHFVPNLTIGAPVVKSIKKISPLPLDVHLMIEKPENFISEFIQAGSDYLTIHVESTKMVESCLRKIRSEGAKPGITLRPGTSLNEIIPYLPLVDLVLIMTVEPGFGGQSFMMDQINKLKDLRSEITKLNRNILIEVDGGVNAETVKHCQDADVLVSGSYIFKGNKTENIKLLKLQGQLLT